MPDQTSPVVAMLARISEGPVSGRELRGHLADRGHRMSGVAFYQFMARMEDEGRVAGWYAEGEADGNAKVRWYRHSSDRP